MGQLVGETVIVEKFDRRRHDLFPIFCDRTPLENWTYLPVEPFACRADFDLFEARMHQSADPYHLVIQAETDGRILGSFALMSIDRHNRTVEMGWVVYSTALQRTRMATEAQYLVMKYVFETLQYRRYEWKCDSLNAPSRRAAERLGFTYEGTFRQMQVYKGRNRDTAWFSILDSEWPANKARLERWLAPGNFTSNGGQVMPLDAV
ncbi:GNAT family protein [Neisseria leonii]|nr:GNAT family protein [Neisseria sp. 51.81]